MTPIISIEWTLGWLIALILGAYGYTFMSITGLWRAIRNLKANDLEHLSDRVKVLETKTKNMP